MCRQHLDANFEIGQWPASFQMQLLWVIFYMTGYGHLFCMCVFKAFSFIPTLNSLYRWWMPAGNASSSNNTATHTESLQINRVTPDTQRGSSYYNPVTPTLHKLFFFSSRMFMYPSSHLSNCAWAILRKLSQSWSLWDATCEPITHLSAALLECIQS